MISQLNGSQVTQMMDDIDSLTLVTSYVNFPKQFARQDAKKLID